MKAKVVRVELLPVEDVPLYTVCPGCLALRVLIPGGGFRCPQCWWDELRLAVDVAREMDRGILEDKLAITRAEVIVVDGPEPLEALGVEGLCELLRGLPAAKVLKTLGLVSLRDALPALNECVDALLFELSGLVAEEKPSSFPRIYDNLSLLRETRVHVELLFPYWRRGAKSILVDIVERYGFPVTVEASDEHFDEAYRVVEGLRRRGRPVYLHNDTSYTLLDVFCISCRELLVERRPWRVRRMYQPPERAARVSCPKCGALQPLIDCRPVPRPRLRRRVVVY